MFSSFFLGANSGNGFYSLYDELTDLNDTKSVYILKGGPGSGKSSFMRRIMKRAEDKNLPVEKIFCSSDPDSLDGIVLPTLKIAVVDGTSPHIVEPKYPLAVEEYVNLGSFADVDAIKEKKDDIISVKNEYSDYFKHIYRMTHCAKQLDDELFDAGLKVVNIEYLKKKARGIAKREINEKGASCGIYNRFTEAISPKGYISLLNSEETTFNRTYIIEDSYGLSHFLLSSLKDSFAASGHQVIVCRNPLNPSQFSHLIIPTLSLAFLTSSRSLKIDIPYDRKIRLDATIEKLMEPDDRAKMRELRRLRESFIDRACSILCKAKELHDKLEDIYNPHIAFDSIYALANELSDKIFN